MLRYISRRHAVKALLQAIRFNGKNSLAVKKLRECINREILQQLLSTNTNEKEKSAAKRSIVLAEPKIEDGVVLKKGVLLITFTHSFCSFLASEQFESLNKRFLFILEPSWTGYADPDILLFCERAEHLVIQATDIDDRALINSLYPEVKTIDIGASNWVNQEKFVEDKSVQKSIDLLYVANNNPVKRVFRFIEVVREISSRVTNLKVVIICAGWGGSSKEVDNEIKRKKLENIIELKDGLPQDELIRLYQSSKASVLFSLKEGSNRVLFESLSCNTPIFCIAENRGVNKSYVNESTGSLAFDSCCSSSLEQLLKEYKNYSPREWALANISPKRTTDRLSSIIEKNYGELISSNLKVKVNAPEVTLLNKRFEKFGSIEEISQVGDAV